MSSSSNQHEEMADNHKNESATQYEGSSDVEKGQETTAQPSPRLYSRGFWDHDIAAVRKEYLLGMFKVTFAVILLVWAIVTIYWGSLWKSNDKSPNLTGWIINRDTGVIGENVTNIFMSSNQRPKPHLSWSTVDPSLYPSMVEVEKAVAVDQKAWIVVDILDNASQALETARTNADSQWDPSSVVNVFYSEARNQQAVNGLVLGTTRGLLSVLLPQMNAQSTSQWLRSNAAQADLLTRISTNAPQTIAGGIGATYNNLRPWNQPVSIAPTFVGLIYAMILAFNITMGNFGLRQGIQRQLRLRSYILMRLFVPILPYLVLSCMFSLINVPFKLNFNGLGLGYGAGFMIWWCFTFLGMIVLGLWTEAAISLAGPQFIGFCLVFIIIINVSVANLPIELQVSLFKYGYAMPFYNLREAYVAIVYNTGKHIDLVKYMGILLAWIAVLFLTIPIWVWLERRREIQASKASQSGSKANH